MHNLIVAGLFVFMVLSPCLLTLRWDAGKDDEWD